MILRVVADTNIYVSAILFGRTGESVLPLARGGIIDLVVSPAILSELRSVLKRTFRWKESQIREALAEVRSLTTVITPSIALSGIVTDDQDHRILECAIAARADFVVTGDKKHLLPLKTFRGIRIVSPRELLDLFQ